MLVAGDTDGVVRAVSDCALLVTMWEYFAIARAPVASRDSIILFVTNLARGAVPLCCCAAVALAVPFDTRNRHGAAIAVERICALPHAGRPIVAVVGAAHFGVAQCWVEGLWARLACHSIKGVAAHACAANEGIARGYTIELGGAIVGCATQIAQRQSAGNVGQLLFVILVAHITVESASGGVGQWARFASLPFVPISTVANTRCVGRSD